MYKKQNYVLVVDDAPDLLAFTQLTIQDFGYETKGCTSPSEAVDILIHSDEWPRLIVTDYEMPAMRGDQFIRALQLQPHFDGTSVILASGEEVAQKVADDLQIPFLLKPYSRDALKGLIVGCFSGY